MGNKMKKTIAAIIIAGTSMSALADSNFSNDFIKVERTTIEESDGFEIKNTNLATSFSFSEHFFIQANAGIQNPEYTDNNGKINTYSGFLGAEAPLQVKHNASAFIKLGMVKEVYSSDNNDDISGEYADAQVGIRWDYGLPRLDAKIFVGKQDYRDSDQENTYYGVDANYYVTKNIAVGVKLIKNQTSDTQEMGFNVSYHW
jgi:hypothetical protein